MAQDDVPRQVRLDVPVRTSEGVSPTSTFLPVPMVQLVFPAGDPNAGFASKPTYPIGPGRHVLLNSQLPYALLLSFDFGNNSFYRVRLEAHAEMTINFPANVLNVLVNVPAFDKTTWTQFRGQGLPPSAEWGELDNPIQPRQTLEVFGGNLPGGYLFITTCSNPVELRTSYAPAYGPRRNVFPAMVGLAIQTNQAFYDTALGLYGGTVGTSPGDGFRPQLSPFNGITAINTSAADYNLTIHADMAGNTSSVIPIKAGGPPVSIQCDSPFIEWTCTDAGGGQIVILSQSVSKTQWGV